MRTSWSVAQGRVADQTADVHARLPRSLWPGLGSAVMCSNGTLPCDEHGARLGAHGPPLSSDAAAIVLKSNPLGSSVVHGAVILQRAIPARFAKTATRARLHKRTLGTGSRSVQAQTCRSFDMINTRM